MAGSRRGFALLDLTVALVFISFVVVSLSPFFLSVRKIAVRARQDQQAAVLALSLLEELRARPWSALAAFDGLVQAPPVDPLGREIPGAAAYTLTVSVGYVTPALAASAQPTSYRKVTVTAKKGDKHLARVSTVMGNR